MARILRETGSSFRGRVQTREKANRARAGVRKERQRERGGRERGERERENCKKGRDPSMTESKTTEEYWDTKKESGIGCSEYI